MVLHTLYGLFIAAVIMPRLSPKRRNRVIGNWSAALLDILNIRVVVRGNPPARDVAGVMFVANHVSWVDIHALNSVITTRFVAKAEILKWPVFGWFAIKANTLFIDREKRHATGKMTGLTREALQAGDCICVFPEGTTTDGNEIKPFKGSLLQAAIDAETALWPFSIHYPGAGESANTEMAYWGERSLIESMRLVIRQHKPVVVLDFAEPIRASGYDRRTLAAEARTIILERSGLL